MKISVVIPCHNAAAWIAEALQSVQVQSTPVSEVIIVNDRSEDESTDVVSTVMPAAKIIETDFGNAAAARNEGVRQASGDWIAFLDSDDWWLPGHLARAHKLLSGSSDVAFFGHYAEAWPKTIGVMEKAPAITGCTTSGISGDKFFECYISENPGWPTSGMVVARERFTAVGGFDIEQVRRHDAEMFARVVHGQTWSYSDQVSFMYRKEVVNAISSYTFECSLYQVRAIKKVISLYGTRDQTDVLLEDKARICVGYALRSGKLESAKRAIEIAGAYAKPWHRIGARVATVAPKSVAYVTRALDVARGKKKA